MSKKFKKTLEEKYGVRGKKGRDGELFFYRHYTNKGYIVYDKEDDVQEQVSGVDFVLVTPKGTYSVDVKNNAVCDEEDISIIIEHKPDGWLFNPKKVSEYITHVSPTCGVIVTYKRKKMQDFVYDNFWDVRSNFIDLPVNMLPFAKVEYTHQEL